MKAMENKLLVAIPVYNNQATVARVVSNVKACGFPLVVVDDGSTDRTLSEAQGQKAVCLSYKPNRGKGYAIRQAFAYAAKEGYTHVLTMDADGQHYASDIPAFVREMQENPEALVIGARNLQAGNMPGKNTFANRFSNFWYRLETGKKLSDTQSGFRLYPLRGLEGMRFFSKRYAFETEIIVKASWRGIPVKNIPIEVYYPPKGEWVSHFKPFRDFARIGFLNAWLVIVALLLYYPWRFLRALTRENIKRFVRENITRTEDSNHKVAASVGLGVFFGIVPIWGYQMIAAGLTAHFLKLNKVLTILSSNISIPPMIPFILYGSFCTGAWILGRDARLDFQAISFENVYKDLIQYVLGAIVFAVACGIAVYGLMYVVLSACRRKV